MATIRPFPAIRYATRPGAIDISSKLAPPYDVLDQAGKDALLAGDATNFVAIDLPHVPPKDAGPPAAYEGAARRMSDWIRSGVLVRDESPAIYAYHQRFRHHGTEYVRKKFFARLRLEEFGSGQVFPHEQTFGGPKEDRLCLTKATRANLSPIFGLYEDPNGAVSRTLDAALPAEPTAVGTLEGVESRLWTVTQRDVVGAVVRTLADKAVYIADGHHRYGTALLYRQWLVSQPGRLPDDHPAHDVLCVFCAMEDPGLLILPTHRVLPGRPVSAAALAADPRLEVEPLPNVGVDDALARLPRYGPQAVALFDAGQDGCAIVRPRDADVLAPFEPKRSPAWRRLGLAFLHAFLLDRLLTPRLPGGAAPEIHYIKAAADAVNEARATRGSAFLLQPTTMQELRDVCRAGDLMPQKSTYFFPKLASGVVVNPLE